MRYFGLKVLFFITLFVFVGCGGGSGSDSNSVTKMELSTKNISLDSKDSTANNSSNRVVSLSATNGSDYESDEVFVWEEYGAVNDILDEINGDLCVNKVVTDSVELGQSKFIKYNFKQCDNEADVNDSVDMIVSLHRESSTSPQYNTFYMNFDLGDENQTSINTVVEFKINKEATSNNYGDFELTARYDNNVNNFYYGKVMDNGEQLVIRNKMRFIEDDDSYISDQYLLIKDGTGYGRSDDFSEYSYELNSNAWENQKAYAFDKDVILTFETTSYSYIDGNYSDSDLTCSSRSEFNTKIYSYALYNLDGEKTNKFEDQSYIYNGTQYTYKSSSIYFTTGSFDTNLTKFSGVRAISGSLRAYSWYSEWDNRNYVSFYDSYSGDDDWGYNKFVDGGIITDTDGNQYKIKALEIEHNAKELTRTDCSHLESTLDKVRKEELSTITVPEIQYPNKPNI